MRNPLSATLQSADNILSTLEPYHSKDAPPSLATVENCLEVAQTIALCVQHQKPIVDGILTISKLGSNLLHITPIAAQPTNIAKRTIKIFDPETQAKNVDVVFEMHPSYQELGVDWVALDPSRVLQILINFMTNAIRFTAPAKKRWSQWLWVRHWS